MLINAIGCGYRGELSEGIEAVGVGEERVDLHARGVGVSRCILDGENHHGRVQLFPRVLEGEGVGGKRRRGEEGRGE